MIPSPVLLLTLAAPFAARQDEDDATRFFALPMVRDTRELAATAAEHLASGRFTEAILALQRVLEDHPHEVLGATRGEIGSGSTHPGAAEWALERLLSLPPEARAEYELRFQPRAARALESALRAPERASLATIPRRWPITTAALAAWEALGDFELEGGQPAAARIAWLRARSLAKTLGLDPARVEARIAWLESRSAPEFRAAPPGIPRVDAEVWSTPLDLSPIVNRSEPSQARHALQPVSTGEIVLVCSTLRLFALDAFSGELRWQAGPPEGWSLLDVKTSEALFEGLDREQLFLGPAQGDGVVLAVLQEPFAEDENDDWQGIEIRKAIPERRLHAYDLASGRELWNHSPRLAYDGKRLTWDGTGSYAQRMMVSGTPVVHGARVLVPCYRMQGRIDYHVACYELATGALLWSTQVVSGQRERNMFGRSVREFCTSPVTVVGERVLAQTELGALAALDLFTGRILWEKAYSQVPLSKTRSYGPPARIVTWRLAAPVVVGDVVVATPSDSQEIVAVRLADGVELWAFRQDQLEELDSDTKHLGFDLLLGADEDRIYLAGSKLSALHKPGGLATAGSFVPRWTNELSKVSTAPRPTLVGEVIIAPNAAERAVFDRRTGAPLPALSGGWGREHAGTLCAEDGALYSLSPRGVSGFFDWRALLARARMRVAEEASESALSSAAGLFLRRGKLLLEKGDAVGALPILEEARTVFERLRAAGGRTGADSELDCLQALSAALARLERRDEARAALDGALALARNLDQRAEVLFQREALERASGGAQRIATLDELEANLGDLPVPAALALEFARRWLSETPGMDGVDVRVSDLPTSLWATLERAAELERAGELAAALEDLHRALERGAAVPLARGVSFGLVLRTRIGRVLARPGGSEAYRPFEERAAELLERARAEPMARGLEVVAERFPHSQAAEEATRLSLEHATEQRDTATVVRLVREALARGGLTEERETSLLLHLSRAVSLAGNPTLERALLSELARTDPGRVSELPAYHGASLAALAAELEREASPPASAPIVFGPGIRPSARPQQGLAEFLGVIRARGPVAEGAPVELHVYALRYELRAYSSADPSQPAWTRPLDDETPVVAFAPGRMVLARQDELVCLDEQGLERWVRSTEDDPPRALAMESGVVVARLRSGSVMALDSEAGHLLWERPLTAQESWNGPLLGPRHVVFFANQHRTPHARVHDLFRGRVTADIRLERADLQPPSAQTTWVAADRLVVPAGPAQPSRLLAFELDGGAPAWTIDFGPGEELHALVVSEGHLFPVTLAAELGTSGSNGGIYALDERAGAVSRVLPLGPGERPLGIAARTVEALPSPYLFTFTYSEGEHGVPIRAIQLPQGILWTWGLPIGAEEVRNWDALPAPAVSEECVALAYQKRRTGPGSTTEAEIAFLDLASGRKLNVQELGNGFDQATRLELRGLGPALFVSGKGSAPRGGSLDILESPADDRGELPRRTESPR